MPLNQQRLQQFLSIPYVAQGAIFFAPLRWAGNLGLEHVDQFGLPNTPLDRVEVRNYCRDFNQNVLFGYLCAMAWGGQGVGVTRRHAINAWDHRARIGQILNRLRTNQTLSRTEAYDLFAGENSIPGIGPSYWTKLIFFFSELDDRYIMDQWTAKSINYLWDAPIVPMSGDMPDATQCTGEIYERFCGCIDELAQIATRQRNEDSSWSGEQIEQRLFSVGGRRPGAFRQVIREWFSNKNVNKSEKKNDSLNPISFEDKLWVGGQTIAHSKPFHWTLNDATRSLVVIRSFNDRSTNGGKPRFDEFSLVELCEILNLLRSQFGEMGIPLSNNVQAMRAQASTSGLGAAIYHLNNNSADPTRAQAASQLAAILVSADLARSANSRETRIILEAALDESAVWDALRTKQGELEI